MVCLSVVLLYLIIAYATYIARKQLHLAQLFESVFIEQLVSLIFSSLINFTISDQKLETLKVILYIYIICLSYFESAYFM